MNILFVGAHHDDLEVAIGGSVARWVKEGHKVVSAILTNSIWTSPDGKIHRNKDNITRYTLNAANTLGYLPINLEASPCLQLRCCDELVVKVLKIMTEYSIDTLITISPHDAHPDHRAASEIALNASRRIPKVLLSKVSWNCFPGVFDPRFFIDISEYFDQKIKAMRCFEDEFLRTGEEWEKFARSTGELYGLQAGCKLAEGFEIIRYRE
jgi:LmbE family N-acetylglucosaminyl deacetylase